MDFLGKEVVVPIVVFFDHIKNCPTEKYYETLRRLAKPGAEPPKASCRT